MDVSWGAATDDVTPAASLQYKLVSSTSSTAIDTITEANAIAGANLQMNWTTNVLTKTATGLSDGTTYYFAVLVRDGAGHMALYPLNSQATNTATVLACPEGQVSVGVYGRSGAWMDQIGIRCQAFDGTTLSGSITDGPSQGGGGGGGFAYDCPSGSALYEIQGGNGSTNAAGWCSTVSTSYQQYICKSISSSTLQAASSKYGEGNPQCAHKTTFDYACASGFVTAIKVDADNTGTYVGFTLGITCTVF
jgi:hypothetical protein